MPQYQRELDLRVHHVAVQIGRMAEIMKFPVQDLDVIIRPDEKQRDEFLMIVNVGGEGESAENMKVLLGSLGKDVSAVARQTDERAFRCKYSTAIPLLDRSLLASSTERPVAGSGTFTRSRRSSTPTRF